jgi:probable rRNA maturation factor
MEIDPRAAPTRYSSSTESSVLSPEQLWVVEVSDTQGHLRVDPAALEGIARRALEAEGIGRAEVSIALVDDATIHALNRRHLGHDWPTDVISFGLSAPGAEVLAGEVVVSAERAGAEAQRRGADPRAELALYLVHGLLHLCGHDDREDQDAAAMRRREAEILAAAGVPCTFPLADPAEAGRESPRWTV